MDDNGISFDRFISDITSQPEEWRVEADTHASYYDSLQLSDEQLRMLAYYELPDFVGNLIHPAVNALLGAEESRRRDWMLSQSDEDANPEVIEALNHRLKVVADETEAAQRCSEAYASMIKSAIGWVYVGRSQNPLKSPYVVEFEDRRNVYYDMRHTQPDLSDCRWIARRRFMDEDQAKSIIDAKYHYLVDYAINGWKDFHVGDHYAAHNTVSRRMGGCDDDIYSRYSEWSSNEKYIEYLLDTDRRRLALYYVYYRRYEKSVIMILPGGKAVKYEEDNPRHVDIVLSREARFVRAPTSIIRRKTFLGPHEVEDRVAPEGFDDYPLVPFFSYREDGTRKPYSPIRLMKPPQDLYNNAGIRIVQILNQKRIVKTADATDMTDQEVVDEVSRRDGVITLRNGKYYNRDMFIEQDWAELNKLYELQQVYAQQIREFSGIYHSFSGEAEGQKSGIAIQSLAELSGRSLAELNANFEYSRSKVGDLLMRLVYQDIGDKETAISYKPRGNPRKRKTVILNERAGSSINNDITMMRSKVVLQDVRYSAGYMQQENTRLMEMFAAASEPMQEVMLPFIIKTSNIPDKDEFIEAAKTKLGLTFDQDEIDAAKKAEQERQSVEFNLQMKERQLKLQKLESEINTPLTNAEVQQRLATAKLKLAQAMEKSVETEILREESDRALIDKARAASAKRLIDSI